MGKANKQRQVQGKKTKTDKIIAAVCIIFAVLIVGTLAFTALNESGIFLRTTNAVYNDEVEVNAAMMSFFLNNNIVNWYNSYGYYISLFGVNFAADLKTQTISSTALSYFTMLNMTTPAGITAGSTWYDYFMSTTLEEVKMYVACAKAAAAENIELSDEELDSIDTDIKTLKESFRVSGLTFSDWFGRGVNESDVRKCYNLMYLRDKYVEHKYDVIEEAIEAEKDMASINKYISENKESFYTADVLSYSIKVTSKGLTDKEYNEKVAAAKAAAENITKAGTTVENFIAAIDAYEESVKAEKEETETETGTGTETGTETETTEAETTGKDTTEKETTEKETLSPEDELESKIEEHKENIQYSTDTDTEEDLQDWLFEESASEGDVNVFEETGTETETETKKPSTNKKSSETEEEEETETEKKSDDKKDDKKKKYDTYEVTAYYVYRANGLDKELTHNFAYLVSDDKQVVFDFIKAFNVGKDKTLDSFYELAEKTYNDIHSAEGHEHSEEEMFDYNKLEKQPANAFGTTYQVLNDWVEDEARKDGELSDRIEVSVVTTSGSTSKTEKQYAVIFFEKHNVPTWQAYGQAGAVAEDFDEWFEKECESITTDKKAVYNTETTIQAITTLYAGY